MFGKNRRIYLDHASATPILQEVLTAMSDAKKVFANPGSIHQEGIAARVFLEEARKTIAHEPGAKSRQIIFTSDLTESNNLAVLGFARRLEIDPGFDREGAQSRTLGSTHWITTSIEHSSILEGFSEVERRGGSVTHVEPDERGVISPQALERALRPNTVLVSIGWGNNEIGVVQELAQLSRVIRSHPSTSPIIFHSDAGQTPLYRSAHVHTLGVDMLSLGAGKLYGPRSSGALYVADPSRLAPILLGGNQEKGLRAGTEGVVPAVGLAKALQIAARDRAAESKRLSQLRKNLVETLLARVPGLMVNGALAHTLPHMLNVSIPGINAEYMVLALDREGIALSTRSACEVDKAHSHVVARLGGPEWRATNTLRISLGRDTTARDINRTAKTIALLTDLSRA